MFATKHIHSLKPQTNLGRQWPVAGDKQAYIQREEDRIQDMLMYKKPSLTLRWKCILNNFEVQEINDYSRHICFTKGNELYRRRPELAPSAEFISHPKMQVFTGQGLKEE